MATRIQRILNQLQIMEGAFAQRAAQQPKTGWSHGQLTKDQEEETNKLAIDTGEEIEKKLPKAGTWGASNRQLRSALQQ